MFLSGLKNKIESYCEYWLDIVAVVGLCVFIISFIILLIFATIKSIIVGTFGNSTCDTCKNELICPKCSNTHQK